MNFYRQWFPVFAIIVLLLAAFVGLFRLRLGGGDVYPEYSSLRADALGTRALYEALGQIEAIRVDRDYRPLAKLEARPKLVMLPGLAWQNWRNVAVDESSALHAAAASGARVVLAFRADQKREDRDEHGRKKVHEAEKTDEEKKLAKEAKLEKEAKEAKNKKSKRLVPKEREYREFAKDWGVTFEVRWLVDKTKGAQIASDVSEGLPEQVAWHSDLYFSLPADSGWRVLYRRAGEPVLIEKSVGRGSIVLLADAYCLSNEAMQRERATTLLTWLVGNFRQVTFHEGALGVLENNGIGFLARRYGLGGAVALCGLLGVLYAWRRMIAFTPTQAVGPRTGDVVLNYEPGAGFTGLLRRSLGGAEVLPACIEEWRKGQHSGRGSAAAIARLETAWKNRDPKQALFIVYNELVRALKPH